MNKSLRLLVLAATIVCQPSVEWTRFKGTVKGINLKTQTLTLSDPDGDLLSVPIDHQVKIWEKKVQKRLQDVELDSKVTLIKTPADQATETNPGDLVPYKGMN